MEAAIRLEVASDVSDKLLSVGPAWAHEVGIDAFVDHRDARLVHLRELAVLPARRRETDVAGVERHEKRRVHDANIQALLRRRREFRVEAEVGAMRPIEKLAVKDDARLFKDVLEEQRLAPTDMGEDHVGAESGAAQMHGTR